jgi:hypothetical protein
MLKALAATVVMVALAPRPAHACAIKNNDVAIVVGVVGSDVATLRIALHEGERAGGEMMDTEWSGAATLVIGATTTKLGRIDPKLDPALEIERLTTLARDRAKKLTGFVAATQVDQTDCSETPSDRCGLARVNGTKLRVAKAEATLDADVSITGIVRYRAGDTEIAVINVGGGDPKFSTSVRPCNAQGCRTITTLHHGEQKDIVVVTRRGA